MQMYTICLFMYKCRRMHEYAYDKFIYMHVKLLSLCVSHAHTHTDMPHTKYLEAAGAALVFPVAPQTLQRVQQSWVLTWRPLLRMIPLCVDCPASSPAPVSVHSAHPQLQTNSKMCWDQYQVSLSMLEKNLWPFMAWSKGCVGWPLMMHVVFLNINIVLFVWPLWKDKNKNFQCSLCVKLLFLH